MQAHYASKLRSHLSSDPEKVDSVILVDSTWIIHRSYHTHSSVYTDVNGVKVFAGDIFGYTKTIMDIVGSRPASAVILCCDAATNFRKQKYPHYKAQREKKADVMDKCMEALETVSLLPSVFVAAWSGYEADDLIYTHAKIFSEQGMLVTVFSRDNDLAQTLQFPGVTVQHSFAKGADVYDKSYAIDRYGVGPDKLLMFRALTGDSSDNLKGYLRFPRKFAKEIAESCSSFEDIMEKAETGIWKKRGRWINAIKAEPKSLKQNLDIMRLRFVKEAPIMRVTPTEKHMHYYKLQRFKSFYESYPAGE